MKGFYRFRAWREPIGDAVDAHAKLVCGLAILKLEGVDLTLERVRLRLAHSIDNASS